MIELTPCTIKEFRDGDSFNVSPIALPNVVIHCRLIATDTPEYPWTQTQKTATGRHKESQYKWGLKAAARTKELIEESGTIGIDFLGDENGAMIEYSARRARNLVLVYLKDGRCLNQILIQEGLAVVFLENDGITPYRDIKKCPVEVQQSLVKAEFEAAKYGIGIWSDSNCLRPQVFRNGYFRGK